jgi:uncharacterized protein YndB with AHSA1/START domain
VPKVTRSRVIPTERARVWDLISDPHSIPRWWPRSKRVEDVRGDGLDARWTAVLETERGSAVRADFRCTTYTDGSTLAWEQELEGTPFERILRRAGLRIDVSAAGAGEALVALTSTERLRGLSRLGGAMVRGAARRRLDEALDGIERALVGA